MKDLPDHRQDFKIFDDSRQEIAKRAFAAKMKVAIADSGVFSSEGPEYYLCLEFPNGRNKRSVYLSAEDADILTRSNFEHWTFLDEYNAIIDRERGHVEAPISFSTRHTLGGVRRMIGMPGVQPLDTEGNPLAWDDIPLATKTSDSYSYRIIRLADGEHVIDMQDRWRLPLEDSESAVRAEISQTSPELTSLLPNSDINSNPASRISLKIYKPGLVRHDDALNLLEHYFSSLSFELDVRFDTMLTLDRRRDRSAPPRRRRERSTNEQAITSPRQKYAKEAVELYSYGRASVGSPLFQYLAYYQAIEYFFPSFHGIELIRRVRNTLRDPRFDVESDSRIQSILNIATNDGRLYSSEKDQLLSTIKGSVTEDDLRDLINNTKDMDSFLSKGNQIKGIPGVSLATRANILEMASDRIYKLRCRIVHSKADGGASGHPDVLLPYSAEAQNLHYDIILIHFICQKVIISGARSAAW